MTETLQVALPVDVVQLLQRAVESREYPSSDEAITEALREWAERRSTSDEQSVRDIEELRRLCDEAEDEGAEFVNPEEVFARLEARYRVETGAR